MKNIFTRLYQNGPLLMTLTSLFWATNYVIGRGVSNEFPPIALALWRWLIASMIFFPFAWPHLSKDWKQIKKHFPVLFVVGALGGSLFSILSYIGLNFTTATNALLINTSAPIFIFLMNYLLFKDKATRFQMIGATLSIIGIVVIVANGSLANLIALKINQGDIWVLSAIVIWGIYTAFLKLRPDIHWLSFCFVTFFIATLTTLPVWVWEHIYWRATSFTVSTFLSVAYIGIIPTALAYMFYNRGVELIGGNKAGIYINLMPLFGTLMAIFFLGEQLSVSHLVGFALILFGVWLAGKKAKPLKLN